MLQRKIDELFQGLPNVFGIADDILIAEFDDLGRDHDAILDKVLRIYRQANQKLNKDKCLFRCTSIPLFFWRNHIMASKKSTVTIEHVTSHIKKGIAVIPAYSQLPEEVLTSNC